MNKVQPSSWLKRLSASDSLAGNATSRRTVRKSSIVPSRTGGRKLYHRQRIVQLLAPVCELRNDFRI